MAKIRVLVADDENLFREMLVGILNLEEDIEVVAEAKTGRETVEKVREYRPDVALVDINLPDLSGIEVTEIVKREFPDIKVVVLTGYSQESYIFDALQQGASGYLSKDASGEKVMEALRAVYAGESLLEPKVTTKLILEFVRLRQGERGPSPSEAPGRMDVNLTPREMEILRLIAKGKSNKEIAERLFISAHTVKTHVSNLLRKLRLNDRMQAILYAIEKGIR